MDESKRCTAKAKRTGNRCGLARLPGTTVCAKHGGSAPQVRAAAERREGERKALEAARKLNVDIEPGLSPVEALTAKLDADRRRSAQLGRMVDDLIAGGSSRYVSRAGLEQVRAEWGLLWAAEAETRRTADTIIKAGLGDRAADAREAAAQAHAAAGRELDHTAGMIIRAAQSGVYSALSGAEHDGVIPAGTAVVLNDRIIASLVASMRAIELNRGGPPSIRGAAEPPDD